MTLTDFLARLEGIKGHGSQYYARCPAHDDNHQSLSVSSGADGQIMVNCHAGCSAEHVVSAMSLTMKDLFPDKQAEPTTAETWKEVDTYPYVDLDGKYAEKVRKESSAGKKSFLWRQDNGRGGWQWNRQGVGHVLYNLAAIDGETHVFVVEGEKDVNTLAKHGIVAVCGADGAGPGKWKPEYTEQLRGKHVAIIQDNDDVGKVFAIEEATALNGVAASVRVLDLTTIWPELPEHGDVSDLIARDGAQAVAAVRELANTAPTYLVIHEAVQAQPTEPTANPEPPKLVFYDTVDYEEPEFLINPYIPLGKLTIIQADSGVGKTALACKLAACVSRGMPMQAEPCETGRVLILSVEDDPSTLRGRIEASGGDLTQCAFLDNAHELTFTSEIIETTIKENGIKFVVFDPLQAFLGQKMDMHRANETRPIMAHLAAMAKRTGCAVVIISHMSKGTAGGKAIYRALGSVDIVAASRSVLYVERNPDNEEQCVILHIKSSNAKPGQAVLYRIGDRGGVQWDGYSHLTVDDLIVYADRKEKGVEYEDEPIVIGARAYIAENPAGGKLTYDEFHTVCVKAAGIPPYTDNRDAAYKIPKMKAELMQHDRILIETGAYVKRNKGISITPYEPPTTFQTGFATEATQT